MKINIYGKHIELGDSLKDHIEESLQRIAQKRSNRLTSASVHISKKNHSFFTEIIVYEGIHHHQPAVAHAEDDSPYHSFDLALSKLDKQLEKHFGKLKSHAKSLKETLLDEYAVKEDEIT